MPIVTNMASFFKRGKKIILTAEKDELATGGARLLSALKETLPLEADREVLLNLGACTAISTESVSILASFARDVHRVGAEFKVTVPPQMQAHFAAVGLDRHFTVVRSEGRG